METTLEVSLYPLSDDYINIVVSFINEIQENYPNSRIITNGLSTQIFADYTLILTILQNEVKTYLEKYKSVFVFKLASGEHIPESIHKDIKN